MWCMKTTKTTTVRSKHPLLFGGIIALNVLSLLAGIDYLAGSILVTLCFVVAPMIYRHKAKSKPANKPLALGITAGACSLWVTFQSVASDGQYMPTLLFYLCVVTLYKMLRFEAEELPVETA